MSDEVELPDGVDESEREAWDAWLANGMESDDVDGFRDAYAGEYYSLADYVQAMFEESEYPNVWNYIDWDDMAEDWRMSGDIWYERVTQGYLIFRNY